MSGRGSAVRWVLAYTVAVAGDAAFFVVLTWAAAEAGGPRWSGLILAAAAIPRGLLMLAGGALADRVNPRALVIGTDVARCAVMVAAALLAAAVGLLPGWLVAVAVVFGVVDAIFMPAIGAMPGVLVPAEDRPRLQAWRITGLRVSNTVGPATGAMLLAFGTSAAFAGIAVLFAVSAGLLVTVTVRRTLTKSARPLGPVGIRGIRDRIRELRLGRLLLVTALAEIPFSGPVAVGLVLLVQEHGWPATVAGLALSAFSVGGLAAALVCTVLPSPALGRPTLIVTTAGTVLLLSALGLVPSIAGVIGITGAMGAVTGVTMVLCHGQIQGVTPTELLGRVTGLLTLLTLGVSPLLYAVAGVVADRVGTGVFFFGAAGVAALAAALAVTLRLPTRGAVAADAQVPS